MSKKEFLFGIVLAAVLGSVLTLGIYQYMAPATKVYQTVNSSPNVSFSHLADKSEWNEKFIKTAHASTESVVHIIIYKLVKHNPRGNSFMEEFFGVRPSPSPNNQDPSKQNIGSGSGVIISDDGYIVTNNHVVEGADEIEIVLNDKRTYTAKLIGTDPTTDLALVKIDEKGLKALAWGDSDEVQIGEWVMAVGNPFNLTSTVTAGIVSAKARNINILRDKDNLAIESFIQTDAAVNPGNSGGALVNLNNKLIGINSAIASPTGAFTGYSFAIPANLAKKVITDLKEYGEVQRALLGVSIQDISAELAKEKDLESLDGVYIAAVRPDGSAAESGLQSGDIITAVNGVTVNSSSELQEEVAQHRPGDTVTLSYIRNKKAYKTKVVLRNKLGTTEIVKKDDEAIISILGSRFQKADKELLASLNIPNGVQAIEIGSGKIEASGMQTGFVVVAVDKQRVYTPSDIAAILGSKASTNSGVLLEGIYPNGQRAYYGIGW